MFNKRGASRFLVIVLTLTLVFGSLNPSYTFASASINVQDLAIEARSAILVEVTTGKVIYGFNSDQPFEPASMTKMMTEYLVLEAIAENRLSWDDVLTASDYVHYLGKYGGSRVFLGQAEKRTVRELFAAMAIYSANDATVMLAERIAGSETNFVHMMNEKAKEFGMKNTHFLTSTGYPLEDISEDFRPQVSGDHYMSAEDAAILGRRLILDHPELTEFTTKPTAFFREENKEPFEMRNWNLLIPGLNYGYDGADGLKTGHTEAAKWCLTATAERRGLRFISVIMGAETEAKRFQETIKLLDYGYNNYELVQLASAQVPIVGQETASVSKGKEQEVTLVPNSSYVTIIRKGEEELYEPHITIDQELLVAPFDKGIEVGTLTFQYSGKDEYGYLTLEDADQDYVSMVTESAGEKANWFRLFLRAIKNMIVGVFDGISDTVTGWFSKKEKLPVEES